MSLFIFILELIGTAAFAISGALVAARRQMDVFGVCIMGLISACGGGVIRDVLLGRLPPVMFQRPVYAVLAVVLSAAVFLPSVYRLLTSREFLYELVMLYADAVGLGVFTAVGVIAAIGQGYGDNFFFSVFLGVMTGVGGGVMRDTLAGLPPYIFVRHIYACASLTGAMLCAGLWKAVGQMAALVLCCVTVTVIRLLAAHFRWSLPRAKYGREESREGSEPF